MEMISTTADLESGHASHLLRMELVELMFSRMTTRKQWDYHDNRIYDSMAAHTINDQ